MTIEAVYIHDLTTGDQTNLTYLLSEGWVIVNRYAKQYHLEKPAVKVQNPDPDDNQVFQEQAVAAYKKLDGDKP